MADIICTADQLGGLLEEHLRWDTAELRLVALEVAQRGISRAVRSTNAVGAVDRGAFKAAWRAVAGTEGAELVNDTPYAGVIEYGRRPNRPGPPLQPIIEWVHRKLRGEIRGQYRVAKAIALGLASGMEGSKSWKRAAKQHVRQAFGREGAAVGAAVISRAMAIRDHVHHHGTKPRFVLRRIVPEIEKDYSEAAMRRLRRRR